MAEGENGSDEQPRWGSAGIGKDQDARNGQVSRAERT